MEYREFCEEYNRMCKTEKCGKCPIAAEHNVGGTPSICRMFILDKPKKAEKIVEKWVKEHPRKTNYDVFCEVFDKTFGKPMPLIITVENSIYFSADFDWDEPYKEP